MVANDQFKAPAAIFPWKQTWWIPVGQEII